MDEQLPAVFQVSKFKYVSLPDSFNYYFLSKCATKEKKKIFITKDYFGEGRGKDRGTLECFIYGKTANYLNKFLY